VTDLDQLLRETFTAHEHLADADRAVALARTPARRSRAVAVTLAAIAIAASVVIGTTYVATRDDSARLAGPVTTQTATASLDEQAIKAAQDARNQAEAQALAVSLLDEVPVMPGAKRFDKPPVPQLAEDNMGVGGQLFDQRGRTWWTAPVSTDAVASFFLSHQPDGLERDDQPGWSSDPNNTRAYFLTYHASTTSPTVLGPELVIQWEAVEGGVVIRADSWVGWRPTRLASSYLNGSATSATIVTLRNSEETGRQVVDGDALTRLATAYDGLLGTAFGVHGCPAILNRITHRVVFHTATANLSVLETGGCDPGLEVRLDGNPLDPILLETDEFRDLLANLAGSQSVTE
jgi:hypothetical protein